MMVREPGLSVRWRLTLSYAALLVIAGGFLLIAARVLIPRTSPPGSHLYLLVNHFWTVAGTVLVGLFAFGLLTGWLVTGRLLAPLERMRQAARAAEAGWLSYRINLPGKKDEFRDLADAFDSMLTKLDGYLGEQQRFAANASHELRTPLAVTKTMLDVASHDPETNLPDLVNRLSEVNDRAIALTEALLVLSRAKQGLFVPEPVDLSLAAEEAVEMLATLANQSGVAVTVSGSPALATGSPALLQQLATNLVHNAIVHNLAEGGTVSVFTGYAATRGGRLAVLVVENTGSHLAPSQIGKLVEPFQRGVGRTKADHGGVGLGLAIVSSIVQAHGGILDLAPGRNGGLRASVWLPVATSPKLAAPIDDDLFTQTRRITTR